MKVYPKGSPLDRVQTYFANAQEGEFSSNYPASLMSLKQASSALLEVAKTQGHAEHSLGKADFEECIKDLRTLLNQCLRAVPSASYTFSRRESFSEGDNQRLEELKEETLRASKFMIHLAVSVAKDIRQTILQIPKIYGRVSKGQLMSLYTTLDQKLDVLVAEFERDWNEGFPSEVESNNFNEVNVKYFTEEQASLFLESLSQIEILAPKYEMVPFYRGILEEGAARKRLYSNDQSQQQIALIKLREAIENFEKTLILSKQALPGVRAWLKELKAEYKEFTTSNS